MIIILTLLFLIIDIISKIIINNNFELGASISVIDNFFDLTYVRNTGAAWSMLSSNSYLVLVMSFVIIIGIIYYLYKNKNCSLVEKVSYSLILGGAIGNFIDRVVYGYVIDFLDFNIFGYDYPIFNFADTFIVIGVFLMIFYTWRCNRDGDKGFRGKGKTR